jgi:hypothetical protein
LATTNFASVADTDSKFAAGVNNTGGNLPPMSTTPVAICRWYQHTGSKFATGVNDTGGK